MTLSWLVPAEVQNNPAEDVLAVRRKHHRALYSSEHGQENLSQKKDQLVHILFIYSDI